MINKLQNRVIQCCLTLLTPRRFDVVGVHQHTELQTTAVTLAAAYWQLPRNVPVAREWFVDWKHLHLAYKKHTHNQSS